MSSSLPNPFFDDMQPRAVAFDSFMDQPQQQQQQQASMFYMQQQQQQQLFQQQHYQQDSLAILPGSTMTQFPTGELCVKNTNIKKKQQQQPNVCVSCFVIVQSFCCHHWTHFAVLVVLQTPTLIHT